MKTLLHSTIAYRRIAQDAATGNLAHTMLVLFPDERLLRPLLKECAKAFFGGAARTEKLIDAESYADCILLPRAGEKPTADMAAAMVDESLLLPVEGERKLFCLDAFHTAAPLVQNKLLKLFEEPPRGVYFLIGAVSEHAILQTVISRAKKLEVPRFSEEQIYDALCGGHVREEGLREAAAASGGLYSVAEDILASGGEDFVLAERFLLMDDVEEVCRTVGAKKEKRTFFTALRLVLRDLLFMQTGRSDVTRKSEGMTRLAAMYPAGALMGALDALDRAEREILFNAAPGQAAFALALRIGEEKQKWQKLL